MLGKLSPPHSSKPSNISFCHKKAQLQEPQARAPYAFKHLLNSSHGHKPLRIRVLRMWYENTFITPKCKAKHASPNPGELRTFDDCLLTLGKENKLHQRWLLRLFGVPYFSQNGGQKASPGLSIASVMPCQWQLSRRSGMHGPAVLCLTVCPHYLFPQCQDFVFQTRTRPVGLCTYEPMTC